MADGPIFERVAPVFAVDDLAESLAFYRDQLGFHVHITDGSPPYFAVVGRGDAVRIHLSEREDTSKRLVPCTTYVIVDDVDRLYEEYRERGIEMFAPPEDQDRGMREFEVRDNNGHYLVFGQPIGAGPR